MFHSLMGANFSHRILSTAVMHGSRLTVFVWQIVEFGGTNNVFVSVSGCTESQLVPASDAIDCQEFVVGNDQKVLVVSSKS